MRRTGWRRCLTRPPWRLALLVVLVFPPSVLLAVAVHPRVLQFFPPCSISHHFHPLFLFRFFSRFRFFFFPEFLYLFFLFSPLSAVLPLFVLSIGVVLVLPFLLIFIIYYTNFAFDLVVFSSPPCSIYWRCSSSLSFALYEFRVVSPCCNSCSSRYCPCSFSRHRPCWCCSICIFSNR